MTIANQEKIDRNRANIKQIVDVLTAANYHVGHFAKTFNGLIDFWIGSGKNPVVALHIYKDNNGFEVFIPVTQSPLMEETVEELKKAIAR